MSESERAQRIAALEHDTDVRPCSAATSDDGRCWWGGCTTRVGVESLALFMSINEIRALPPRDPRLTKEVER